LPVPALAEGTLLAIDPTAQVGSEATDTYAAGYRPKAYQSGSEWVVDLVLPLKRSAEVLGPITVTPVVTETYPCVPDNTIVTIDTAKAQWVANFHLRLTNACLDGTQSVSFQCAYAYKDENDVRVEGNQTFTIYFGVEGKKKPAAEPSTPAPSSPVSLPRLMLVGYQINPQEVVAGSEMTISVEIKNESAKRSAQNIKLSLKSEDATFLPIGGANAVYIAKLKPGASKTEEFRFSVKPDAEVKPSMLLVEIAYEDSSATAGTETATISIPVQQPIRLKLDEPQVYGEMVGQSFTVSMNLYNMGKSTLYNVLAELKGDFITPEGSYYGGNIESGGTKTVELMAVAKSMGGGADADQEGMNGADVQGKFEKGETKLAVAADSMIAVEPGYSVPGMSATVAYPVTLLLTYEDANGKQYTVEKEVTVNLMDESANPLPDEPTFDPEMPETPTANLTWLWVALGVLAVAGLVTFLVIRSKKRKRVIEDEIL